MSRQSRLSDMTMDADAEEMRLDYMLKKCGIIQRTRLEQAFCWLEHCVERVDQSLLHVELEKVRTASKADKVTWHDAFHTEVPARAQVGRQRSAQVRGLCAPLFVLRNQYQESGVMSHRIEEFIGQHYDARPSDSRRRLARSLVGVLQAFEALDVESGNSVYVQQCAGMNLSLLWKICRQPSDIDVIDGEGLEIYDEV